MLSKGGKMLTKSIKGIILILTWFLLFSGHCCELDEKAKHQLGLERSFTPVVFEYGKPTQSLEFAIRNYRGMSRMVQIIYADDVYDSRIAKKVEPINSITDKQIILENGKIIPRNPDTSVITKHFTSGGYGDCSTHSITEYMVWPIKPHKPAIVRVVFN